MGLKEQKGRVGGRKTEGMKVVFTQAARAAELLHEIKR